MARGPADDDVLDSLNRGRGRRLRPVVGSAFLK